MNSPRVYPPDTSPGTYWKHSETGLVIRIEWKSFSGKMIRVTHYDDGPQATWRTSSLFKVFLRWLPLSRRPRSFAKQKLLYSVRP